MANEIYQQVQGNNPQAQFGNFMKNPFQFLMQKQNVSVPEEYRNDPHGAVNFLVQNGKMDQNALNTLVSRLQKMGFRF